MGAEEPRGQPGRGEEGLPHQYVHPQNGAAARLVGQLRVRNASSSASAPSSSSTNLLRMFMFCFVVTPGTMFVLFLFCFVRTDH